MGENKDSVEEALFLKRQDLFSELSLAFFDTTSFYFEGQGGESLGQYGNSKDHRPDLKQMVMGAVLTGEGRPVCCELWPGNQADSNSLLPVVDRLRERLRHWKSGSLSISWERGCGGRRKYGKKSWSEEDAITR
jgi:transposase